MPIQLRRETLAEQVADGLIALIEDGALVPGTLLPSEANLTQEFGVSRPVVREALKALAAKDVVAIANGKGAVVRPISSDPLQDFFLRALRVRHATMVEMLELRRGVEMQCASLAARRRTAPQLSELRRDVDAMRDCLHDREAYRQIDIDFHLVIAAAAHNTLLFHLVESMREPMQDSMRAVSRRRVTEEQHDLALTAHIRIVDAIDQREPAAASSAMGAHFDEAIRLLSEFRENASQ